MAQKHDQSLGLPPLRNRSSNDRDVSAVMVKPAGPRWQTPPFPSHFPALPVGMQRTRGAEESVREIQTNGRRTATVRQTVMAAAQFAEAGWIGCPSAPPGRIDDPQTDSTRPKVRGETHPSEHAASRWGRPPNNLEKSEKWQRLTGTSEIRPEEIAFHTFGTAARNGSFLPRAVQVIRV